MPFAVCNAGLASLWVILQQHLHSNGIRCSGVNTQEAWFVTNPALGNQTIMAPLSYDAERRVGE
jgi:hypothetical protein